ncbi:hypothetical protein N7532_006654 [Penicillium argentinense]|uniref:Uncharacterized protein n=1 Tax=Penicillium argentinense TaxID=1131581 RepID=A0A9W9FG82_9EURO|nr:uncharacterized protein N7532_006654 [Penicillium argentinense]KAJ5099653.1 hypothetical protein N7532_006654 [Penicillium argentinense]
MTESSRMQQPAENIQGMFTADSGAGPPTGSTVQTQRALDPHSSLEDYNRTLLEYTQRQMSSFVDLDDGGHRGSGASSRSSQSSGNSGQSGSSNNGTLAHQANGPPPTSASAQHQAFQRIGRNPEGSPNEAKPSRY